MAEVGDESDAFIPRFTHAFQPIVDTIASEIFSYEALIRGPAGESAQHVFTQVGADSLHSLHRLDRESRVAAVALAGGLRIACHLNINMLPRSVLSPDVELRNLLEVAERSHVSPDRLIVEVTEGEMIDDHAHFADVIDGYREVGIQIAIDDFGAGHSGLNLLADLQPDMIKLDMNLVRGIESRGPRQSITRAIATVCGDLGIDVVAEGVETLEEFAWLEHEGVRLFQGYLFAEPGFESLPPARYPHQLTTPLATVRPFTGD
jgi:EAL domain-containing protein (putative c-di-GMP-specific phosphodiesterase class I)